MELDTIGALVKEVGKPVVTLLLLYLILTAAPTKALLLRLANGQASNGAPKSDLSGQASIDFWKLTLSQIVQDILDQHERDEARRTDELVSLLREMKLENREGFERLRQK